jgi:hypothetical protein
VVGGLAFWVDDLAPDHGELLLHGGRAARQEAGYSKKGTPIRSPRNKFGAVLARLRSGLKKM